MILQIGMTGIVTGYHQVADGGMQILVKFAAPYNLTCGLSPNTISTKKVTSFKEGDAVEVLCRHNGCFAQFEGCTSTKHRTWNAATYMVLKNGKHEVARKDRYNPDKVAGNTEKYQFDRNEIRHSTRKWRLNDTVWVYANSKGKVIHPVDYDNHSDLLTAKWYPGQIFCLLPVPNPLSTRQSVYLAGVCYKFAGVKRIYQMNEWDRSIRPRQGRKKSSQCSGEKKTEDGNLDESDFDPRGLFETGPTLQAIADAQNLHHSATIIMPEMTEEKSTGEADGTVPNGGTSDGSVAGTDIEKQPAFADWDTDRVAKWIYEKTSHMKSSSILRKRKLMPKLLLSYINLQRSRQTYYFNASKKWELK